MSSERSRAVSRILLGTLFIVAGILHFVIPDFYLKIMPPWLPWHLELVYISGVFEFLGGIGVLIQPLRRIACYGLIALLIAVFPANVQHLLNWYEEYGWSPQTFGTVARLPVQLLLILWVWRCSLEPLATPR